MITSDEYFQDSISNFGFTPSEADYKSAADLLDKVNALFPDCQLRSGHRTREKTLALIAAGYRAALGGNHEKSLAVDVSDPLNLKDDALNDAILEEAGLWRETPHATPTWCHLQSVPPKSGARTFQP